MNTRSISIRVTKESIDEFEKYLYERENAEATIRKYITDIRTFFRFLDEDLLVDKNRVLKYKEWLISKYSLNSVNSILAALNTYFNFLDADYLKVRRIKVQKPLFLHEEKEITQQEYRKLIQTARSEGKDQLAMCMETIALTGIRISELKHFTLERVKQGKIEVYNKGKFRKIFLSAILKEKLLEYCEQNKILTGYIFITKSGRPKDRSNIWTQMKALEKRSGIDGKKIFPHNLRHLFARVYYQNTKDLTGLADILGHSSLNVTRIYTANTGSVYQKQIDEVMKRLIG